MEHLTFRTPIGSGKLPISHYFSFVTRKTYSSLLTYLRTAVVSKTERVVASQVCNVVSSTNVYDYDTAVSLFSYCRSRNEEPL